MGQAAFHNLEEIKQKLHHALRLRIEVEQLTVKDNRVLVFNIPSRPPGTPVHHNGRYLMRSGESLVPMSPEQLQRIIR